MHLVPLRKSGVTTEDRRERPGKVVLAGAAYRVFGFTLQGLNQSIVGLSPLSETA
jgi:hypothetical protein